jgi:ribonuclease G
MPLPEWLIERGVGETRAALIEDGEIVEARIELEGLARTGRIIAARLKQAATPAIAVAEGVDYLLPKGAPGVTEGAALTIEVTRQAIPGAEPWKRALARITDERERDAPPLTGRELIFPAPRDELAELGWNDLIEQARSGMVAFVGGDLRISPTPAMTLIDVDGYLSPDELALLGAAEAARAIRRLDIGGSIGIDLPTVGDKSARQAAAAAIDAQLPQPFERTAVNGFGFVQIVRPRQRAALVELAQDRAAFEARALLRRAAFERSGAKDLVAHPLVIAALTANPAWIDELSRQVGGAIGLRAEPKFPMSGGHAANP